MIAAACTVLLPISPVATGAGVFLFGQAIAPLLTRQARSQSEGSHGASSAGESAEPSPGKEPSAEPSSITSSFRYYRILDLQRIIASLKANAALLVTGEEGSGKSVLASAVVEQLTEDGYTVAFIEPTTPKQMLKDIAEQLGLETQNLQGKEMTAEKLKAAIAGYFQQNVAFLVIDDAQNCELKFRNWLKALKHQGVPMLLLATDPPKKDVFINLSRIGLSPLPEYAIRELMETAAMERGINLKPHELARLQERVGGNPMLAARVIDEEYMGIENEAGDHRRYFDMTPLILLIGVAFVVMRFIALGTGNPAMYVLCGSAGALFAGASYAMRALPKESKRFES